MTFSLKTLPIDEKWDCHGCGLCCYGKIISLDDEELGRLREQNWGEHPTFQGTPVVVRQGLFGGRYRLAHRSDGACVFLTPEGRCRIHQEHGEAAKPRLCRLYPFQLVPAHRGALATLRRSCPSAAADQGTSVERQLDAVRRLAEPEMANFAGARPPAVIRRHHRCWDDTLRVSDAIERIMLDRRYPPVRRLVHGLGFCRVLETCHVSRLDSGQLAELISLIEESVTGQSGDLFAQREPPSRAGGILFRQTAAICLRLHPQWASGRSWRDRLRWIRSVMAIARAKGRTPPLHPQLPITSFESLERPLGHLDQEIAGPLHRYFETAAASRSYAMLERTGWPLVDSFKALALSYPIALWLLRWLSSEGEPTRERMLLIVGILDRAQTFSWLAGPRHRRRVRSLGRMRQLERLVAWYGR